MLPRGHVAYQSTAAHGALVASGTNVTAILKHDRVLLRIVSNATASCTAAEEKTVADKGTAGGTTAACGTTEADGTKVTAILNDLSFALAFNENLRVLIVFTFAVALCQLVGIVEGDVGSKANSNGRALGDGS